MYYAQEKSGKKLHLVYDAEDKVSQPICGKKVDNYRMTINVPLGNACKNCLRIYRINKGQKIRSQFYESLK